MTDGLAPFLALPAASVLLLCFCGLQVLRTARRPVPVYNTTRYSRTALRFEKSYKIFAWGVMMAFFLVSLVISFVEVFARL